MHFTLPLWASSLLGGAATRGSTDLVLETAGVKQVAIIGAGAAGASTAYHLHKFAEQEGIPINVTIFEKTNHIGGRTLTVDVHDDPLFPVELGASIFVDINHILYNATRDFNLTTVSPGSDEDGLLGIWDGTKFVYTQDSSSWGWWNLAKLFWKYGTAPYHVQRLMKKTVGSFLNLYDHPYFPFRSLSTRAFQLGLVDITALTGQQFLAQNKLDGDFAHDIVQASTRVNYASNINSIHGLGTMVAMAPDGAVSVAGGNWQIFSNMVKASGAYVNLNSPVTSIFNAQKSSTHRDSNGATSTLSRKYGIQTGGDNNAITTHPIAFDDIVIANPFQYSNISLSPESLIQHPIDPIPYAHLHVTLFATSFLLHPAFFNLPPAYEVPISVLTTTLLNEENDDDENNQEETAPDFYSISLVKTVINPTTEAKEYVFKIFSPEAVTPEFLSRLLGVQVPDTFISPPSSSSENHQSVISPITWYHPTTFHPYPRKLPRVTFQDPVVGNGLWYTSGIESFISTMETSALMGMNVAKLVVDNYALEELVEEMAAPHPSAGEDQDRMLKCMELECGDGRERGAECEGCPVDIGGEGEL